MKLRLWVKCALVLLAILAVIGFIKWNNEEYDKCMNYTNGNKTICDKLK